MHIYLYLVINYVNTYSFLVISFQCIWKMDNSPDICWLMVIRIHLLVLNVFIDIICLVPLLLSCEQRTHTGEKSFACTQCSYWCAQCMAVWMQGHVDTWLLTKNPSPAKRTKIYHLREFFHKGFFLLFRLRINFAVNYVEWTEYFIGSWSLVVGVWY